LICLDTKRFALTCLLPLSAITVKTTPSLHYVLPHRCLIPCLPLPVTMCYRTAVGTMHSTGTAQAEYRHTTPQAHNMHSRNSTGTAQAQHAATCTAQAHHRHSTGTSQAQHTHNTCAVQAQTCTAHSTCTAHARHMHGTCTAHHST
jgi:hypothetical protein